jgi:hypothetical protein
MATIPAAAKLQVDKLRDFLRDRAELNILLEKQESTDQDLYQALQDGMDAINYEYGYETNYTLSDFPSWKIIRDAALLEILTSAGIHSARNMLTYNDAGGVTIQDMDVYGRYINYYNVLITKIRTSIQNFKIQSNINNAYGGSYSAYGEIW